MFLKYLNNPKFFWFFTKKSSLVKYQFDRRKPAKTTHVNTCRFDSNFQLKLITLLKEKKIKKYFIFTTKNIILYIAFLQLQDCTSILIKNNVFHSLSEPLVIQFTKCVCGTKSNQNIIDKGCLIYPYNESSGFDFWLFPLLILPNGIYYWSRFCFLSLLIIHFQWFLTTIQSSNEKVYIFTLN